MKKKLSPLTFILCLIISNTLNATNYSNDTIGDPIKIIRSNQRLMLFCNNKITFELGSQKLNESARYELGLIASRLIQNPNLKIEIGVFNDTRSAVDYSKSITEKRANSIKDFFISNGVKGENLIAIGFGDSNILNKCKPFVKCTNTEHNVNKRVEMKILNPGELESYTFVFPKKK